MARTRRRRAVGVVALALALAACSRSSDTGTVEPEVELPPATSPADTSSAATANGGGPGTTAGRSATGDVLILLDPTVTATQLGAIQSLAQDVPGVRGVRYISQQQAYDEFVCLYAGQPALLARVTPASLPPSLRVDAGGDLSVAAQVQLAVRGASGVGEVIIPSSQSDPASSANTAPVNLAVPVGRCTP
jgi:hypothetical protein